MRLIPTRLHGMLDYLVGALLIAAPWLFDFYYGGPEMWVPVVLGAGAILYSMFTNYELGLVRLIPMPVHLMLDIGSGILLVIGNLALGLFSAGIVDLSDDWTNALTVAQGGDAPDAAQANTP